MPTVSLLLATVRSKSVSSDRGLADRLGTRPTRRRASVSTTTRPSTIPASTRTPSTTPKVPLGCSHARDGEAAGARHDQVAGTREPGNP